MTSVTSPRPQPRAYRAPSLEEHLASSGRKRILALDGGGVRGLLTLGILRRIESLLRLRHGDDPAFRLCDYFDLIAGTSTGSIIAALLVQGHSVDEVIELYRGLATSVFTRPWWRVGLFRPRYNKAALEAYLQQGLGSDCRLGDEQTLRTGLLVVTKRIDSGSPWPLTNTPRGRYFNARAGSHTIPNADFPLWKVVRASTAAPTFFAPEWIEIAHAKGTSPVQGNFVDGGVSPHNNPSLQAYLCATLKGYGMTWNTGADQLLIVSVGTGRTLKARHISPISVVRGVSALQSLMDDCSALVEALMQGMGECRKPRRIDAELGTLSPNELVGAARFRYRRYDVKIYSDATPRDGISDDALHREVLSGSADPERVLKRMARMDDPSTLQQLLQLGLLAGERKVEEEDFPELFDLPPAGSPSPSPGAAAAPTGRRPYRRRPGSPVLAIQLTLLSEGFHYEKWGGRQTCKPGDWIVNNNGNVYSVDADSFARTYRPVGNGLYVKHTTIWAEPAAADGAVATKEGHTHYRAGDYLVFNEADGQDPYAITRDRFEQLYEPLEATMDCDAGRVR